MLLTLASQSKTSFVLKIKKKTSTAVEVRSFQFEKVSVAWVDLCENFSCGCLCKQWFFNLANLSRFKAFYWLSGTFV